MKMIFPNCTVVRWVDGDTVDLNVDHGFRIFSRQRFRLARVKCPEKGEPGFIEATNRMNELAPVDSKVIVTCTGYDRYGRWIAEIDTSNETVLTNMNSVLLEEKLATEYKTQ